jgi:hypothetical protein
MAAAEKSNIDSRELAKSWRAASREQFVHFPLEFGERSVHRRAPGIEYNFPLRIQMVQPKADGLADPPADSVAHDGAAQSARHGEADARTVRPLPADAERREQGASVAVALVVNPAEVFGS